MSFPPQIEEHALSNASAPPLIEAFGIRGLYGYRDISLNSANAATILIARNGSGKTTLLGVLNAFLKIEFSRLRNLDFSEVFCRFRNSEVEIVLRKVDIVDAFMASEGTELTKTAQRLGVSTDALFKFITEDWSVLNEQDNLYENPIFAAFAKVYGYATNRITKVVFDLQRSIYDKNPSVAEAVRMIRSNTHGYEILYLPTYRRVELALREDVKASPQRRRRPKIAFDTGNLFTGDIQFGLSDITDRLADMNESIAFQSNTEYRKISANIISDLIDGSFEKPELSGKQVPSKDDLDLLFSRVEQSRRHGPYYPVTVPNLDRLYSPFGVPEASKKFLNYFLGQLDQVIETTRAVELRVQEFVNISNRYLASDDVEAYLDVSHFDDDGGKRLVLDKANLRVTVESPLVGKIDLDALSSGEKQMISLFAKLYLYESPKIILIDEPELSLSIGWQRQILVDVIKSPLCRQLIAITHSPFVFDNELEPFAGSLLLSTSRRDALRPFNEDSREQGDDFDA